MLPLEPIPYWAQLLQLGAVEAVVLAAIQRHHQLAALAAEVVLLKLQEATEVLEDLELLVKVITEDNLKELELVAHTEAQAEAVAQVLQVELTAVV